MQISKLLKNCFGRLTLWGGLSVLMGTTAPAQTSWIAGSGDWHDSLNWSFGLPSIASAVSITNAGDKVITISAATPANVRAARRLDVNEATGATNTLRLVNLGAGPFQLANSATLGGGSRLEISNSALMLDGAAGGSFNLVAGTLVIAGGGLSTTNSDPLALNGQPGLRLGRSGNASALVQAGEITACDELVVGDLTGANGTLVISNGIVQSVAVFNIANNAGATGTVVVAWGSLISTNVNARIGDDGDGTLTQFGGVIRFAGASVGRGSNSVGRIQLHGGLLQPESLSIGRFPTAQGTVTITGGTLEVGANTLYVGREGHGTLTLMNGAVFAEAVVIAASNTAAGTLQMRGGSLTAGQLLATSLAAQLQFSSGTFVITQSTAVANGAAFVVGDGSQPATLQLDGGPHTFANGLIISANAVLKGSGTVVGAITVLPGGSNQLGGAPAAVSLTPQWWNGQFVFVLPSEVGKSYDVLAATNLVAPVWTLQTTLSGTGNVLHYTNTAALASRFFRVQIR